jgi:hypothetical protein
MRIKVTFLVIAFVFISGAFQQSGHSVVTASNILNPTPVSNYNGNFKVEYPSVKKKEYAALREEFRKNRVLEEITNDLNNTFVIPSDITVEFAECGEANAFYDPQKQRISMCYELIKSFYDVFGEEEENEDELDDAVVGATIFVFYHELGHALVHVLDLPITGKEEDAVDQLSLFILTDGTDDGEKAALDGARFFYLDAQQEEAEVDDLPFWDEHSLGQQRFYNIICGVYGQNPSKYQDLVKENILPEERAERCEDEYQQIEKSWAKLLAPFLK